MTFDELMVKYQPLIDAASVDDLGPALIELKPDTDTRFKRLVVALEEDLAGVLEGPSLRKGAVMAAKELISMRLYPEGHGATLEGAIRGSSYSEVDGLDPAEAAEPAPPPVFVEFSEESLTKAYASLRKP